MNIRRGVNFDDFDKGYEMGKIEGYDEGYDEGYGDGEGDGRERAIKEFRKDESDSGFEMGLQKGFNDGLDCAVDALKHEAARRANNGQISRHEYNEIESICTKMMRTRVQKKIIRDYNKKNNRKSV